MISKIWTISKSLLCFPRLNLENWEREKKIHLETMSIFSKSVLGSFFFIWHLLFKSYRMFLFWQLLVLVLMSWKTTGIPSDKLECPFHSLWLLSYIFFLCFSKIPRKFTCFLIFFFFLIGYEDRSGPPW